jgi:hypothetical protein|tara:strand:- start:236 stop:337 length:102 start_codon:yes stop_codon:yes gene_type:complete
MINKIYKSALEISGTEQSPGVVLIYPVKDPILS